MKVYTTAINTHAYGDMHRLIHRKQKKLAVTVFDVWVFCTSPLSVCTNCGFVYLIRNVLLSYFRTTTHGILKS